MMSDPLKCILMKKLLSVLAISLILAATSGCDKINANIDYSCKWSFKIINELESDISVINGGVRQILKQGEQQTVYTEWSLCGKDDKPGDIYPNETYELSLNLNIEISNNPVSSEFLKRKYWTFVDEVYSATYTLSITDELIGLIGFGE